MSKTATDEPNYTISAQYELLRGVGRELKQVY